ncbi:FtsX-like permease family protein [Saccharopolyspora shandongensis]|uniref:FtsX-like permease family protein n=1 Tax=Saccharopolyspora shandongensis TaxID=418495 RepID=A0A1H2XP10_9PSEU|nr:FtsX-like permease family protein [Saccharopolyspora shandongensis]SDW94378.1 FtsX-like permease family protein [Saccharopolyspora shandongensis]
MTTAQDWMRDLAFGLRLAVTGRRAWGRLVVTAAGVGLGVALLLAAASIPNVNASSDARFDARWGAGAAVGDGASVLVAETSTQFREEWVQGVWVQNLRPDGPVAPGLRQNPRPGEVVVSPALQEILSGPDGALLQPRFPNVVGVIADEGLIAPNELFFYAGTDALSPQSSSVSGVVDHFGEAPGHSRTTFSTDEWLMLALGLAALLVPIVVYVAATTRLAETARQRRLSAMRLVGAGGEQIRRMAAGEALAGALLGVVLGWALFFLGRTLASGVTVVRTAVFEFDITPVWWLALLVTAGIPAVAVVVTIGSLAQAIADPLDVTRRTVSRRRRLGWRLVPLGLGLLGLLAVAAGFDSVDDLPLFVVSVVLVLVGIPVLLPWCVERAVGRLRGGSTAWQLAIGRLQLASGPAARSVSAIAVVVAGVIALQTLVATVEAERADRNTPREAVQPASAEGRITGERPADAAEIGRIEQEVRSLPGIDDVQVATTAQVTGKKDPATGTLLIADCAQIARLLSVPDCRDGDAFVPAGRSPLRPGERVELVESSFGMEFRASTPPPAWDVPESVRPATVPFRFGADDIAMVLTPAAGVPAEAQNLEAYIRLNQAAPNDLSDRLRNVAAAHFADYSAWITTTGSSSMAAEEESAVAAIRAALLAGALLTFALIGCSLFVSAAEQIQERRRPLAVLGAVGVPRRTLRRSQLLQNAVPMLVATALATVVGMLLGTLTAVATNSLRGRIVFDLPGMLGLFAFAAAAVLVVTALTLPALGRAAHPTGLRTE